MLCILFERMDVDPRRYQKDFLLYMKNYQNERTYICIYVKRYLDLYTKRFVLYYSYNKYDLIVLLKSFFVFT